MTASGAGRVPAIRLALRADVPALAALKRATFRETFIDGFGIAYPPEDQAIFEAETYGELRLSSEIADRGHATWVVEAPDGDLIAYAHAGPCKLPHDEVRDGETELYQLYMLEAWKGGALGRALMERALGWMEGHSRGRQWLGVWSGNERAQRFYARFGFERVGNYDFAVGDHRDHEFILRRG
ncbi:MAG TPA: GNAT family N-acetyltransferase [Sphingobium sp.]|uniref:GNAT family N-acetyltransferase n=1 Tax=Sphingobium sp. TaxID=1912891 RepID=UPI002ED49D20